MSTPQSLKERAVAMGHRVRARVVAADRWLRTKAAERPLLVLTVAIGVGSVVGRIVRGAAKARS
jgi:hypothetical protein